MPSPTELLAVARLLSAASDDGSPSDAQRRRAVSTAYYALFHHVLRAAAQRFVGMGHETTAGYAILYRGFDHRRMKDVCEALQVSTLSDRYQRLLHKASASQDARDFAGVFPNLQDARHRADYDPAYQLPLSEASFLIDAAELAMGAFDRIVPEEQADNLALMMVGARI